ncbi:hypothetical protein [Bradyrhizobium betae]|uniref:DUF4268 domain-containing protein n=1 Tax=Bradyrhizobium betae TaxID=244734 RepID=A0A5P6P6L3_9BRAD|nr:hypothetical protein [Bradyrhizobium betae]MCS3731364.1 hypothetical protein [Bradyrhizobium betae]QFI73959.1 DUF4268 domain-containing protein [Bradyrhizobium betae]
MLEAQIQELVHAHSAALPIAEIDPMFVGAISVCREMQLGKAGRVDNFLITPSGLPVLVECKLWRNPEARREVIGQILDYAKVLSRWSFSDLQREVARRTGMGPDALLQLVRTVTPNVDEIQFTDAVTANLRRGRFLLLILGDGVREDVEAIAGYLQIHAGLHFTFGLVEFPVYRLPSGEHLVAPRVVARTTSILRNVVAAPEGFIVQDPNEVAAEEDAEVDPDRAALAATQQAFWKEFLDAHLQLDDRTQSVPKPARQGYLAFMLPAPQGSSWLTVYRDLHKGEVGVFLSASQNSPGEIAMNEIVANWDEIKPALNGTARLTNDKYNRTRIIDSKTVGNLNDAAIRKAAFDWLAERVNTFVNVLRPRIRDVVADEAGRAD